MRARGYSMVEVMLVMAIAAVLLGLGIPTFRTMMASTHTRSTADSIYSGLQLARAEAIRRNAPMRFQLVSNMTNTCAYSSTSMLWVATQTDQVTRGQIAGACTASPYIPPDQLDPCNPDPGICPALPAAQPAACRPIGNPANCSDDPWVAYRSAPNVSPDVTVTARTAAGGAAASVVTFGPLGQILPNIGGAAPVGHITIAPAADAEAKTWAVRINTTNGGLKFCDPAKVSPDPLAC